MVTEHSVLGHRLSSDGIGIGSSGHGYRTFTTRPRPHVGEKVIESSASLKCPSGMLCEWLASHLYIGTGISCLRYPFCAT